MIMKFLLVAAVIAVVYFMFIKKKTQKSVKKSPKNEETQASDMVECESCGLYTQLSEALLSGSNYYCSQECLNKGK
jgi:late competence protein required for DNA uptake (superfamily II DNA/RNA helicase)